MTSSMDSVIKIVICHSGGFVWKAEDILSLRKNHRIVGCLEGCLSSLPRQLNLLGRPLRLSHEEIYTLLGEKFAKLVEFPQLSEMPSESPVEKLQHLIEKAENEQRELVREERVKQIKRMADKILLGKVKKAKREGKSSSDDPAKQELDREAVIEEEIRKIQDLPTSQAMVRVFTEHPVLDQLVEQEVSWDYPRTDQEKVKAAVFTDLWRKGFYITGGEKFGGDFLVYPGDPVRFHAEYIALCVPENGTLTPFQIAAHTRVATSVKKKILLCTLRDGKVAYKTIQWLDGKRNKDRKEKSKEEKETAESDMFLV